jgi:thiosulfate reductase cytochrome b subunit
MTNESNPERRVPHLFKPDRRYPLHQLAYAGVLGFNFCLLLHFGLLLFFRPLIPFIVF